MSGGGIFDAYGTWYEAFYRDKDYGAEARYLLGVVESLRSTPRTWLDVGCGTGDHLAALSGLGIAVEGVDASSTVIARARGRYPGIPFHVDTAQDFSLDRDRDVVSFLFHVVNYQATDEELRGLFVNAARHLAERGVVVFDFWHTDGVLRDPPQRRVREVSIAGRRLFRIADPTEDRERRRVDVRYEFRWDALDGQVAACETHPLRHFDVHELEVLLADAGLDLVTVEAWMERRPLRSTDWYGLACAALPREIDQR